MNLKALNDLATVEGHQESLLETANDNGISGEAIQREMLAHLEEIPYGYFSDEA